MNDFSSLIMYVSFFSLSCLLIHLSQIIKKDKHIAYVFFLVMSFIIPLIISGFRYDVGTDYMNYIRGYNLTANISFTEFIESKNIELGFFLIKKIAYWFNNYQVMFWISTIITLVFAYKAIIRHEDKVSIAFSLMMYLFVIFPSSFNIMRQHIALAIAVYSYRYIFERNFKKFLFFCIIASSFHITALIVLPFYFVVIAEKSITSFAKKKKIFYQALIIIASILFIVNFSSFINTLSQMGIFERYYMYSTEIDSGLNREIYLKGLILIAVLLYSKKLISYDERNKLYIYFLVIDLIVTFVGFSNPFTKRIGLYFGITQIFLLPSIIKVMNNKVEKYLGRWAIVLYSIGFFILAFYIFKLSHIIPYKTNIY